MPVEQCDLILNLEPTTVPADMPLEDVAAAMMEHPDVHVASVVADDGRLIGIIQLRALADDLFFHILPEEFLSEVTDLEHVMSFATKSRMEVASDAMSEAIWVKRSETVKDAFKRMHEHDLPGLPVVDDLYRVIGYINLLELLALCSKYRAKNNASEKLNG
jgi:CBS-domain-containing membrane protein